MAKWSANTQAITPIAVADATNFTSAGYLALQGGSATQVLRVSDIFLGGQAAASAPTPMVLARDSTVGATLSGGYLAAHDPATAALAAPPVQFTTSTTKPQRSATLQLGQLAFNAFGGLVRVNQPPGWEWLMLGNTASFGELSLSCANTTGTPGLMTMSMGFEPM
jgi:hypothetical protein